MRGADPLGAVRHRCTAAGRRFHAWARASMIRMSDRTPELPENSVLDGLQPHRWDGDAAVQYEVAIEMLSQQIAECTGRITTEESQPSPDATRLLALNGLIDSLTQARQELRSDDTASVQNVLRTARQRIDEIRAW